MTTMWTPAIRGKFASGAAIDLLALALVYFTPAISHLLNFPLYLAEPMRLMLILAMVHTRKANAYLLAVTLPLFSYAVSAHPVFPKMALIAIELTLNVYLFYLLSRKIRHLFAAAVTSILLSKMAYYILKFILIQLLILDTDLFSTPLLIQVATSLVFSLYLFFFFRE